MLYHLPGPRLTDTLRLSGSELKCRQKTAGDFATSASAFSSLSRVGPQRKEEKRRQEERRRKKSNKKARRASSILIPPNSRSPAPGGKISYCCGDGARFLVSLGCCGAVGLWCCGVRTVTLWSCGTVVSWCGICTVTLWCREAVVPRCSHCGTREKAKYNPTIPQPKINTTPSNVEIWKS